MLMGFIYIHARVYLYIYIMFVHKFEKMFTYWMSIAWLSLKLALFLSSIPHFLRDGPQSAQ